MTTRAGPESRVTFLTAAFELFVAALSSAQTAPIPGPSLPSTPLTTNDGDVLVPAHGTTEMPVWGPVFKGLDRSDTMTRIRIENIVNYLESIQVK